MPPLALPGCAPTPLAHYLKALGVLRLVSEQAPRPAAPVRGAWVGEHFELHSDLDHAALLDFFLGEYHPTPILAPWNGGSGFAAKDKNQAAVVAAFERSPSPRFADYRQGIAAARAALGTLKPKEKPSPEEKDRLLTLCRATFPEPLLEWLDAALVLTADGAKYPPLLGTGGNDGRLEFTNNHLQRLSELFDPATGAPRGNASELLEASLFAIPSAGLSDAAIGQFFPHAAGGPNTTSGFDGKALVNPWDFVLMLEGSLMFAAAAVKRLESAGRGELAYPFCVRPAGIGYASASPADDAATRCEFWAPLWANPASADEVRAVLAEGRAQLNRRIARDGLDFARAIVSLGVERGIGAFQRYSFQARNGLAYFATPLKRLAVRRRQHVSELLDDLERNLWFDRLRQAAHGDHTPARVRSGVRRLEQAAIALCGSAQEHDDERSAVESLLLAVADVERALGTSLKWTQEKRLKPLAPLPPRWFVAVRDASAECELACSLASFSAFRLREHWEPLDPGKPWLEWLPTSREVLWRDERLVESLLALHLRRLSRRDKYDPGVADPFAASRFASPESLLAFVDGDANFDLRLARLTRALSLIDFGRHGASVGARGQPEAETTLVLPAVFALFRLALAGRLPELPAAIPRVPAILRRAASSDATIATELAVRRLRASGFTPAVRKLPVAGDLVRRAAAATLFPVSPATLRALMESLRPVRQSDRRTA